MDNESNGGGSAPDSESLRDSGPRSLVRDDVRRSLIGGGIAVVVAALSAFSVGTITSFEARILIEAVQPGIRFLTSAAIAAGTTALALMLTLIGLSFSTSFEFRPDHYRRIRYASGLTTVLIVASTVVLLFLAVPIEEAEALGFYYTTVYYVLVAFSALIGGLVVALVLMLNFTVRSLAAVGLGTRSLLIHNEIEDSQVGSQLVSGTESALAEQSSA